MKKKQEIVIKIQDFEIFQKYISPDYNKLVCINVFDKFWGPCEVMDPMVKKLLDTKDTAAKIDFICADKDVTGDIFSKHSFTSKPKFFILHVKISSIYLNFREEA
jgi:hypothetical protein